MHSYFVLLFRTIAVALSVLLVGSATLCGPDALAKGGSHSGGSHSRVPSGSHNSGSHSGGSHSHAPSGGSSHPRGPRGSSPSHRAPGNHYHAPHSRATPGVNRDNHGRIERSEKSRQDFKNQTGYSHGRPGYVIDHVVPLKRGGADAPSNMQWQTKSEAKAKDRWE